MKCPHCGKDVSGFEKTYDNVVDIQPFLDKMDEERKKEKDPRKATKCYDCYYADTDPQIDSGGAGIAGDWYCTEPRIMDIDGSVRDFKDGNIIQEWCPYKKESK